MGPSGAGKTVLGDYLKQCGFQEFISITTRNPRAGEISGVSYNFISEAEFDDLKANDALAEYVEYRGNKYGLTIAEVELKNKHANTFAVMTLDGVLQFREKFPNAHVVFVTCSKDILENRMRSRGDSDEAIQSRMDNIEREMQAHDFISTTIVNDSEIEFAQEQLYDYIQSIK